MRLLFVAPVAVLGGVAQILEDLVVEREAGGYEADVLFLHDGPAVDRLRRTGLAVDVLDAGRMRSPRGFSRAASGLRARAASPRPDTIVSMEPAGQVYAAWAARRLRVPSVWWQLGLPARGNAIDRLASRLPARGVVAPTEFIARRQRELTRAPVRVVTPGISTGRFEHADGAGARSEHGIAADETLVCIVGRLQPWKGQHLFLEAAAIVLRDHPQTRFAVVGGADMGWEEGDYPGELRALAERLGIAGRVVFTGTETRPERWFAAADVAVHASAEEPFGLVVCEALASGTPLVTVPEGGPVEMVQDGRTGLVAERRDGPGLARAIGRLLDDPALRKALSAAGRVAARERFGRDRMARDFGAAVAGLATGRAAA